MHDPSDPPFFSSSQGLRSTLTAIVFIVTAFHLLLLGISIYGKTPIPPLKPPAKIIVQTVRLHPLPARNPAEPANSLPPPPPLKVEILPPVEPKVDDPAPASMPEKEVMPQEEIIAQNEQILTPKEASVKNDPTPQPSSAPVVAEIIQKHPLILPPSPKPPAPAPRPAAPNTASKEKQKEAIKKTEEKKPPEKKLPEKKPLSKKPPEKNEPKQERKKTTLELEADKKREIEKWENEKKQIEKKQIEQVEKIRKQIEKEETEKKRLQRIAEAEKKRQTEIAEQEMRRQKEIAAVQEAAKQKVQAHLSKAKENLAKIGEMRDKFTSNSSINLEAAPIPKELGLLQVDALPAVRDAKESAWGLQEASYSDEVAYRLKMSLRLPDYGSVKIKLTLDRSGKVIKIETVQTQSAKNKAYVESKIPAIVFPPFGQRFLNEVQNTFAITLQNDS